MRRTSLVLVLVALIGTLVAGTAMARQEQAPLSHSAALMQPAEVMALEVPAIEPELLLAEDHMKKMEGPGPLRFALPFDVQVNPDTHGTWELVPGGAIWRLRVVAPGATDLNFGFGNFWLPKGATLHVASLTEAYFQGPYTADDNRDHGQLWTPVVPGDEAMIELFVPDAAEYALDLVRVGSGYRDLFRRDPATKSGSCNVNVICPLGDAWRDQIRSVAVYGTSGSTFCTGTLVNNVAQNKRPFFLTANHCEITSSNAASVVTYWNYQSSSCSTVGGGTLNQSTSGATWRASNYASDYTLLELSSQPAAAYNVYYAGFDARTTTAPASSIGIHHPNTDEKAISFNDDALTTVNSCIGTGGTSTHWQVNNWEQGTTEPGSSGSALFDPATKLVVGTLSGGSAACGNSLSDCYGKMSYHWGVGMSTWLDPNSTGTRYVAGLNGGSTGGNLAPTANFSSSTSNLTATFTDTSTDSDGTVTAWSWSFGDGATSTTRNPSRTYAAAGTYTVTLTVTDNGGATGTTSKQVTVSSSSTVVDLTNNVALTGQSAAKGAWKHYRINVPAGSTNLVMQISGGTGDADLYTKFGAQPTSTVYDCRPYLGGNAESCTVAAPSAGYYYLGVYAYAAYATVTVKASFTAGGGGGTELVTNGGFETGTTPWVLATYSTRTSGSAQAGTYKAQMLGRGVTTSTNFYQPVAGFNGATKTLKFYLKMTSAEGTTTAYDYLYVRLKNTSGTTVSTLATYSNKNKTTYAGWTLVTLTVPATALTNYRIAFDATEDSSAQTTFFIDGVSIK